MRNQGRQGVFSNKINYLQGWRSNQNQSFKQGPFLQQQQPQYPSSQEKISKLEDALEKFMQASLSNQKNFDVDVQSLETQMGQIAQQLKKSKEQCKLVTTRSGIIIRKGIGDNLIVDKEKKIEEIKIESEGEKEEEKEKESV